MVLLIGISLLTIRYYAFTQQEIPEYIKAEVKVTSIQTYTYSDLIIVRDGGKIYQFSAAIDQYKIGDILQIEAQVEPFRGKTIPYGFNLNNFKLSRNIKGSLEIEKVRKTGESASFYALREEVSQKLETYENSVYLKAFILGENSFSSEQKTVYRDLGILFLFTVSGLHIYTFLTIAKKVFFYLNLTAKTQKIATYLILGVFLYLNAFSMSLMRIFLMYVFYDLSKKYELQFTKLDVIHFVFFVMLMINIYWIYHLGLVITYLILVFLFLMQFSYIGLTGYFKRLVIALIIFAILLPFTLRISVLMILLLPLIVVILTIPLFLMAIIIVFIPELEVVFNLLVTYFEILVTYIQNKNITLYLPALSFPFMVIYYSVLIYVFRSREIITLVKRVFLFVLLFSFFIFDYQIKQTTKVYMIDVGQGDSFLVHTPTCTMLIDSYQYVLPFLNDLGVYHLDYLILTHADNDHIKEAASIVDNIFVGAVLINPYDDYPRYNAKTVMISSDDVITCGNYTLVFLGPIREYESRNNNSLVFQIEIDYLTFLFTGDIELEAEQDLVEKYRYRLDSDILKVAHHGSSTSSQKDFLYYANPKVALISASDNNRFGFPHQDVLSRFMLQQVIIYRTDQLGTVIYSSTNKKGKWVYYAPFPV